MDATLFSDGSYTWADSNIILENWFGGPDIEGSSCKGVRLLTEEYILGGVLHEPLSMVRPELQQGEAFYL